MPFAPITLETHKSKMFYNSKKGDLASKFMTLTYSVKKMIKFHQQPFMWIILLDHNLLIKNKIQKFMEF